MQVLEGHFLNVLLFFDILCDLNTQSIEYTSQLRAQSDKWIHRFAPFQIIEWESYPKRWDLAVGAKYSTGIAEPREEGEITTQKRISQLFRTRTSVSADDRSAVQIPHAHAVPKLTYDLLFSRSEHLKCTNFLISQGQNGVWPREKSRGVKLPLHLESEKDLTNKKKKMLILSPLNPTGPHQVILLHSQRS